MNVVRAACERNSAAQPEDRRQSRQHRSPRTAAADLASIVTIQAGLDAIPQQACRRVAHLGELGLTGRCRGIPVCCRSASRPGRHRGCAGGRGQRGRGAAGRRRARPSGGDIDRGRRALSRIGAPRGGPAGSVTTASAAGHARCRISRMSPGRRRLASRSRSRRQAGTIRCSRTAGRQYHARRVACRPLPPLTVSRTPWTSCPSARSGDANAETPPTPRRRMSRPPRRSSPPWSAAAPGLIRPGAVSAAPPRRPLPRRGTGVPHRSASVPCDNPSTGRGHRGACADDSHLSGASPTSQLAANPRPCGQGFGKERSGAPARRCGDSAVCRPAQPNRCWTGRRAEVRPGGFGPPVRRLGERPPQW